MPQPYFVPVSFTMSRKTQSRGVSPGASTVAARPFTVSLIAIAFSKISHFAKRKERFEELNDNFSMKVFLVVLVALTLTCVGCTHRDQRGIADKRTNFERFLPMTGDPARYSLKPVRPFFHTANRPQVLRAIERACQGGETGSSVQDPHTGGGYYVNCNPENRQLLNGYVPTNPRQQPHSRGRLIGS